jgi:uncharacterized protein (DUF1697 family)
MPRHIALLRGINLGSHNRVSMPELRELLAGHGHKDVETLVQSGNIVLTSRLSPKRLEQDLRRQIAEGLGVDTPVVVRTRDEIAAVVELNPLAGIAKDPKRYQVTFLTGDPDPDGVKELEEMDLSPETLVVKGREVYTWHPDGVRRWKAREVLSEKRIGVSGTARNWNTVTKLLELADGRV